MNVDLSKLKARDAETLRLLFEEVNPYLMKVCFSQRVPVGEVSELVHQAWEQFFLNIEKFEGRSSVRTFICGILINKIREHRRQTQRVLLEEDAEKVLEGSFSQEGWWNVQSHNPFRLAELKEASAFVKECLEGLTPQQSTAFVLKEIEEENSEDICNVLGVSLSHLRVLLFRAKDKLRKCLEGKVSAEAVVK